MVTVNKCIYNMFFPIFKNFSDLFSSDLSELSFSSSLSHLVIGNDLHTVVWSLCFKCRTNYCTYWFLFFSIFLQKVNLYNSLCCFSLTSCFSSKILSIKQYYPFYIKVAYSSKNGQQRKHQTLFYSIYNFLFFWIIKSALS